MRRPAHLASMILLATTALGASHAGCIDFPFAPSTDEKRTSGGVLEPMPTPARCVPSQSENWISSETCGGVFVSVAKGNDENPGTSDKPVKSLPKAIALAETAKKPVYACADEFTGPVEVPEGITLFGGLQCDEGWRWIGNNVKTTLTAPPGTIPLTITATTNGSAVRLDDIHVVAKPIPQDGTAKPGTSSIAAVVASVTQLELKRCVLEAGDAAPGLDGEPYEQPAKAGENGNAGKNACTDSNVDGGDFQVNDCGTPEEIDDSIGGAGGDGQSVAGGSGQEGTPPGTVSNAGRGQVGTTACASGMTGEDGANGEPGDGATGDGSITPEGYIGASGAPGTSGTTAQGGGGGGGARGVPTTTTTPPRSCPDGTPPLGGASGGSGGAGGCGGAGGKGGGPGGASIALISINSELSFNDVTIKTGSGGKGGNGGPGQDGGMGGMGGPRGEYPEGSSNLLHGCDGGPGGTGGNGGTGGGGRGGHSIGIAFEGATPALKGVTFELGEPGVGGAGSDANHDGESGRQADRLEF
ncbi:PGRS family protein [Sorangium sp. So ce1389]|uniref:PGRS family protein n=1 Tax=Sorangium sp. So ce1389 TaxID=3133336 RepID=UPI003F6103C9